MVKIVKKHLVPGNHLNDKVLDFEITNDIYKVDLVLIRTVPTSVGLIDYLVIKKDLNKEVTISITIIVEITFNQNVIGTVTSINRSYINPVIDIQVVDLLKTL